MQEEHLNRHIANKIKTKKTQKGLRQQGMKPREQARLIQKEASPVSQPLPVRTSSTDDCATNPNPETDHGDNAWTIDTTSTGNNTSVKQKILLSKLDKAVFT